MERYIDTDPEKNETSDPPYYCFAPVGEKSAEIIIELFRETGNIEFHRIPEEVVNDLRKDFQDDIKKINLEIEEDRKNWDYVYNREDLVSLEGNKYRGKRR